MVRRQGLAKERTQNIEMRLWGSCINIKDVSWANKPVQEIYPYLCIIYYLPNKSVKNVIQTISSESSIFRAVPLGVSLQDGIRHL